MNTESKQAFTMIELIFVVVIIGILASVAIPRLAVTRDDAEIAKARTMVASVRNALAMERQKRILRGEFKGLSAVGGGTFVFGYFYDDNRTATDYLDDINTTVAVLEYPITSEPNTKGRWSFVAPTIGNRAQYIFNSALGDVIFEVLNGKFVCNVATTANTNVEGCRQLTN